MSRAFTRGILSATPVPSERWCILFQMIYFEDIQGTRERYIRTHSAVEKHLGFAELPQIVEDQASEDLVGSERESVQEMLEGQFLEGDSDRQ